MIVQVETWPTRTWNWAYIHIGSKVGPGIHRNPTVTLTILTLNSVVAWYLEPYNNFRQGASYQ